MELAQKILRYMKGTAERGITIDKGGKESDLTAWTDAGFSGLGGSASQTGIVITWAGSILVWKSCRQSIVALSTAEAELYAAAMGWSIIEGLRHLLEDLGFVIPKTNILVDNKAAISIAVCGANWRTRYFAVRGHRLYQECLRGSVHISHCGTKDMVADALTKLAPHDSIMVLDSAMSGEFPSNCGIVKAAFDYSPEVCSSQDQVQTAPIAKRTVAFESGCKKSGKPSRSIGPATSYRTERESTESIGPIEKKSELEACDVARSDDHSLMDSIHEILELQRTLLSRHPQH